jgi:hypothetical protein
MAGLKRDLWPEEHSPFGDLEPAFAEPSAQGWDILHAAQGKEESRADFDQRVAILRAEHDRKSTKELLIVCMVCELKGNPCSCARCVPKPIAAPIARKPVIRA